MAIFQAVKQRSKVELSEYMKRLRRNLWVGFGCLAVFGGTVCYTEIILPPKFFVLTLLQAYYEYIYYNPKSERDFHECIERGFFKAGAKLRAKIAVIAKEMGGGESTKTK